MLQPLQDYELKILNNLTHKAQIGQANQNELVMLNLYTERYLAYSSKPQQIVQQQYSQPMYSHKQHDMGNNPGTYNYTTKEDHSEDNVEADSDKVNVSIMAIKENFKMNEIKISLTESILEKLGFGFIEIVMRDNILLYAYNKRDEMDSTLYKIIGNEKDNELLISNDGIVFKINRNYFGQIFEFGKICKVRYRNIDTLKEVFMVLEELDLYHKTYFDSTYDIDDNKRKTIISNGQLPWTFEQAIYR